MPVEVWYEIESQLLRLRARGPDTLQDWESSKFQVLRLSEKHACNRLLADVRDQESTPDFIDIYSFGADLPREIHCAILVGQRTRKEHRFLETVAQNRGIPMRDFIEEAEAIDWLNRRSSRRRWDKAK